MTEYLTFENEKKKYKVKYPKNWTVKENKYEIDVIFLAQMPPFASNVNVHTIIIDKDEKSYTIDQIMDAGIHNMGSYITNADNFIKRKRMIAQKDARQVTFRGEKGDFKLKFLQVMVIHDYRIHIITYSAEASQFHESLDIVNEMLDSYEIL